MRRLNCAVQQYAWGKRGSDSRVARLKKRESAAFTLKEEEPYAELWMGTHPNGPSRVVPTDVDIAEGISPDIGVFLIEHIETFPHYLGELEDLGDLPFMFKILSIDKALSIQAHPDKRLAERLYATRPDLYKDDNHKPEMAVALSPFEGLCGFRDFQEISWNLRQYPELRALAGTAATAAVLGCRRDDVARQQTALAALFRAYITATTTAVAAQLTLLVARLARLEEAAEAAAAAAAASAAAAAADAAAVRDMEVAGSGGSGGGGASAGAAAGGDEAGPWGDAAAAGSGGAGSDEERGTEGATDHEDEDDESALGDATAAAASSLSPFRLRGAGKTPLPPRPVSKGLSATMLPGATPRAMAGAPSPVPTERQWQIKFDERMRREDAAVRRLMLRLSREYPGDIGIMMPLLLNYLRMGVGESFFMAANEPHAYLCGDIMEVMARSDNVVRVALTPKYRDVPLLLEVLTYNMGPPPVVEPRQVDQVTVRYTPPITDFELEVTTLPAAEEYHRAAMPVPQILLCLTGRGRISDAEGTHDVAPGAVLFVPAHVVVTLAAAPAEGFGGGAEQNEGDFAHGNVGEEDLFRVVSSHTNRNWAESGCVRT